MARTCFACLALLVLLAPALSGCSRGRVPATPVLSPSPTVAVAAATAAPPPATAAPTSTARSLPSPTPEPTATPAPEPVAVVQVAVLNLRSGPGMNYAIVGKAARGDELYPIGKAPQCEWLQVRAKGREQPVWVAGGTQYVSLSVPCDTLEAAAAPPSPVPATKAPSPVSPSTPAPAPEPKAATPEPVTIASPRPDTGLIGRYGSVSGPGELIVKNGTDTDGVVILAGMDDAPVQAAYVRLADSFRMTEIANGSYRLYFTKGENWDGEAKQFTRNVTRQRFEDVLTYASQGNQYAVYTVTLYGVVSGNAATERVPADEFPALP